MSAVVKYRYPSAAEIRGRMDLARAIQFSPRAAMFYVSESEQDLFHTARRLHEALTAALADLALYVGQEPTLAEEALYEHEQQVRARIAQDVNRARRPEFPPDEPQAEIIRTVRAVDIQLIEDGSEAPYWVPEAGEPS